MTYKEFCAWCNERTCDGFWGFDTVVTCINIIKEIEVYPFWRKEKAWRKINEERKIVENYIEPTNKKIQEFLKLQEERLRANNG